MDEFFAQLIANVAEARAKREGARAPQPPGGDDRRRPPLQTAPGSAPKPPTLRAASSPATPPARPEGRQSMQAASRVAARAAPVISAIEAADPFAAVAAASQSAVPSASSLLAAFSSRDGLLAGIVLSETLSPPLALRRERDR